MLAPLRLQLLPLYEQCMAIGSQGQWCKHQAPVYPFHWKRTLKLAQMNQR